MKKSQAILLAAIVCIVSVVATLLISNSIQYAPGEGELPLAEFSRAQDIIENYYLRDYDIEDVQYAGLKAMVAALGDPYSVYYTPEEFSAFTQDSTGEYFGVGMGISIDDVTGLAVVTHFLEDSAAKEAGIEVGDLIVSVNGEDATKKTIQEIRVLCIGKDGTSITIGVKRGEEVLEYAMLRRSVSLDMAEYRMLDGGMGYMRIKQFSGNCAALFHKGIEFFEQQGAQGIIFDLRNNPGGYLETVVNVLDELLPEGLIVYTQDKHGNKQTWSSDAQGTHLPLVLLVNGHTASASEIFAGAIQDYGIGEVVGTRTYGKGVVQVVIPITATGGGLKITSSEYFTPNGRSIDGNGVYPDHFVEQSGEGDVQLEKASEVLAAMIRRGNA